MLFKVVVFLLEYRNQYVVELKLICHSRSKCKLHLHSLYHFITITITKLSQQSRRSIFFRDFPTFFSHSNRVYTTLSDYNNMKYDDSGQQGIYTTQQEMGGHYRSGALQQFGGGGGGIGPNGLTKKQELMVRSAIKYWVERHKHVVR